MGRQVYRIHPAIGVARVGNSQEYFDGPEVHDQDWRPPVNSPVGMPARRYRDASGKLRRQAALFRIYEYTYLNETPDRYREKPVRVREITLDEAQVLEWTVQVANLKSFVGDDNDKPENRRPIDPAAITVSGRNAMSLPAGKEVFGTKVMLGEFSTDDKGRLRALPGFGKADGPIPSDPTASWDLRVEGWYDDVGDGPVKARLVIDGQEQEVESAWLVTGSPRYAQPVPPIVSLYDLAFEIALRKAWAMPPVTPSFVEDIYPILHTAVMTRWVASLVQGAVEHGGHDFEEPARFELLRVPSAPGSPQREAQEAVFQRLKVPLTIPLAPDMRESSIELSANDMPKLDSLTLTLSQYKTMQKWSTGGFLADWPGARPTPPAFASLTPKAQAKALDEAHLRSMCAGGFGPGIEVGRQFRNMSIWTAPFRISGSTQAGQLTSTLAVPWQADFGPNCGSGWWPASRPDSVLPEGSTSANAADFKEWTDCNEVEAVQVWQDLGFVAKSQDGRDFYVETERIAPYPGAAPASAPTSGPTLP